MNDKHIEDILRESWSPEPPEGMRDRVLRRGREALLEREDQRGVWWLNWRSAVVAAGVLIVLATNMVDMSTQSRVTQMMRQTPPECFTTVAQSPMTLGQWRHNMDVLLATNRTADFGHGLKGVDTP